MSLFARLPAFVLSLTVLLAASPEALAYEKAVEGPDVVLNKLFPKKNKVELDGKVGMMLNSSYQQTFFVNGGLTYFWSENWGFQVEGYFAAATDKTERECIESFYNDPNFVVGQECDTKERQRAFEDDPEKDANYGPAYVPIRQLKYMFIANAVWNPIYGKQIVLLSATNYFDFYLAFGGGLAMSDFYPKTPTFEDGRPTRGSFCTKKTEREGNCTNASENPGTLDDSLIGKEGRPLPQQQTTPVIHMAVGQRFHFFKRFLVTASLENFTLVGTESGFENFFALMGGAGVRF